MSSNMSLPPLPPSPSLSETSIDTASYTGGEPPQPSTHITSDAVVASVSIHDFGLLPVSDNPSDPAVPSVSIYASDVALPLSSDSNPDDTALPIAAKASEVVASLVSDNTSVVAAASPSFTAPETVVAISSIPGASAQAGPHQSIFGNGVVAPTVIFEQPPPSTPVPASSGNACHHDGTSSLASPSTGLGAFSSASPSSGSNPSQDGGLPLAASTTSSSTSSSPTASSAGVADQYAIIVGTMDPFVFMTVNGRPATEDTPYEEFRDWIDYLLYCHQGRLIRCRFGYRNEAGIFNLRATVFASRKLLMDSSQYFHALFGGPWVESQTGTVDFDDIDARDFLRLYLMMQTGRPGFVINHGRCTETLQNLLVSFKLADRFMCNEVAGWVSTAFTVYLQFLSMNWKNDYLELQRRQPRVPGEEASHLARVRDFSIAYINTLDLSPAARPVQPGTYVKFLVDFCPRHLLMDVWNDLAPEMTSAIGFQLLQQV